MIGKMFSVSICSFHFGAIVFLKMHVDLYAMSVLILQSFQFFPFQYSFDLILSMFVRVN